jgi:hypothetical protein
LIGGADPLFNGGVGHRFKEIKHQTAQGCGGHGLSLGWRTFALERKHASVILARSNWGVLDSGTEGDHRPVTTTQRMPSKKTVRMGDEGKAVGCVPPTALLFEQGISIQDQQNQILNQHDCGHARDGKH